MMSDDMLRVEGCTVVDPSSSVLVTHLADVLKRTAHLILRARRYAETAGPD